MANGEVKVYLYEVLTPTFNDQLQISAVTTGNRVPNIHSLIS